MLPAILAARGCLASLASTLAFLEERARRRLAETQARAAWAETIHERAAREAAEAALRDELVALRSHVVERQFDSGPLEDPS